MKNKTDIDADTDFGFTFADSEDIKTQSQDKVHGLRKLIMPLLNNLLKNPEKDTIVWPNREKTINAFIKKMDDYIGS